MDLLRSHFVRVHAGSDESSVANKRCHRCNTPYAGAHACPPGSGGIVCPYCASHSCFVHTELAEHVGNFHANDVVPVVTRFGCPLCSAIYANWRSLRRHLCQRHPGDAWVRPSGAWIAMKKKAAAAQRKEEEAFGCDRCPGFRTSARRALLHHMIDDHFECPKCRRRLDSLTGIYQHIAQDHANADVLSAECPSRRSSIVGQGDAADPSTPPLGSSDNPAGEVVAASSKRPRSKSEVGPLGLASGRDSGDPIKRLEKSHEPLVRSRASIGCYPPEPKRIRQGKKDAWQVTVCAACNYTGATRSKYERHLDSKRHKANVAEQEQRVGKAEDPTNPMTDRPTPTDGAEGTDTSLVAVHDQVPEAKDNESRGINSGQSSDGGQLDMSEVDDEITDEAAKTNNNNKSMDQDHGDKVQESSTGAGTTDDPIDRVEIKQGDKLDNPDDGRNLPNDQPETSTAGIDPVSTDAPVGSSGAQSPAAEPTVEKAREGSGGYCEFCDFHASSKRLHSMARHRSSIAHKKRELKFKREKSQKL